VKKLAAIILCVLCVVCLSCPSTEKPAPQNQGGVNFSYVPKVPDTESSHQQETMGDKTALRYFQDEKILAGWNLGNTLDAHVNGKAGEILWGNPPINQQIMDGVKAAGFDLVRIPVTWMGQFGPAPDYHIEEAWLRRVGVVVDMAHKAGLKVIINLHHDGSTSSKTREAGWLSVTKASKSVEEYNRITQTFIRLWQQIALYFKNYGDWLIFEPFNELHDGGWGWSTQSEMNPQIEILNEWTQFFTDVVRATGGNNSTRYFLYHGYCASPRHTLASYFILPRDTVPGKQIVGFHYYEPSQFGIEGKVSGWGTPQDIQNMDAAFELFKAAFIDKGIPVVIGETGAVKQIHPGDAAKETEARNSRLAYLSNSFRIAKKYGLVPVYWDNGKDSGGGEKFGLLDRATGKPLSDEGKAMLDAMIGAVKLPGR